MNFAIRDNFERLGLHNSYIESIQRLDQDMILTVSHGYLENSIENDIEEAIVFDIARITLRGIKSESFSSGPQINPENVSYSIPKPEAFELNYSLIVTNNSVRHDHGNHQLRLGMIRNEYEDDKSYFVEWSIDFEELKVEWDKHIMHKHWFDGSQSLQ